MAEDGIIEGGDARQTPDRAVVDSTTPRFKRVTVSQSSLYEIVDEFFECTIHFDGGLEKTGLFNDTTCFERIKAKLTERFPATTDSTSSELIPYISKLHNRTLDQGLFIRHANIELGEILIRQNGTSDQLTVNILLRKPPHIERPEIINRLQDAMSDVIEVSRSLGRNPINATGVQTIEGENEVSKYRDVSSFKSPAKTAWKAISPREKLGLALATIMFVGVLLLGSGRASPDATNSAVNGAANIAVNVPMDQSDAFLSTLREKVFTLGGAISATFLAVGTVLTVWFVEYYKAKDKSLFTLVMEER